MYGRSLSRTSYSCKPRAAAQDRLADENGVNEPEDRQAIEAEAAEWAVRLEARPLDADERRALKAWRDRSEAHEMAFRYARQTWGELAEFGTALPRGRAEGHAGARRQYADRVAPVAGRSISRRWLWHGIAASVLLAAGVGVFRAGDLVTTFRADQRTAPGEIRTVLLPDGSRAELNTRTAIAVDFHRGRREIRLLEGEAVFAVAVAPKAGPFVVLAAGGEARALGTRFLVSENDGAAEVTVLEHQVAVTPPDTGAQIEPLVLKAGQTVAYSRANGPHVVRTIDLTRVATWRRGILVFDRVPLTEAVAELNRYRRGRIMILDSDLATRHVSGVFRIEDVDSAVDVIAGELGARTLALPPFVTALY